jgi:hypothetical protein
VLYMFGFERVGVLISDMFIVIPTPLPGQEGAERGVRLEVRLLEPGELRGSLYSARPIEVGQPLWRADLLEAVDGPPGSLNRAHHHPAFRGWEPGTRVFDPGLTASPVQWVGDQLADLEALFERAGLATDEVAAADARSLRGCLPEIMDTVGRLLDRVRAGELAVPPGAPGAAPRGDQATVPPGDQAAAAGAEPVAGARVGWL